MLVYKGILSERGKIVPKEDAVTYAMAECGIQVAPGMELDPEFAEALEEWFYSANWNLEKEE